MSSTRGSLAPLGCESRIGSTSAWSNPTNGSPRIRSWDDSGQRNTWRLGSDDKALSDLYTKLTHIQWRKNANDRNIRRALDTTKHMYDRDLMLQLTYNQKEKREQWTEAIICDEIACAAEISESFLREWEQREEEHRKRCLTEVELHLKSIKRVELALSSKWGTKGKVTPLLDEESATPAEGGQHRVLSGEQTDSSMELMDKLWALRREVKEKRRELRRAGKKHGGKEGGFRAANFKTGRGRL